MESVTIVLSLLTLAAVIYILVRTSRANQAAHNDTALGLLQHQMEEIRGSINKLYPDLTMTLQNVDKNMGARLDKAAQVIGDFKGDFNKKMSEVYEATKNVQEAQKDLASLQEILRSPKIRGGMGELSLGNLLAQVLPPSRFKEQYRFKSGEIVDAVIELKEGLVPIDSKYPWDNFRKIIEAPDEAAKLSSKKLFIRDVKKHIDDISKKYILPDEGTFNFALMYVYAENIYYEIIIKDEDLDDDKSLLQYAFSKKVVPVSPNSFYAYLQTILLGLRGMKIEEQAHEILKNLTRLEGDFEKVMNDFNVMGKHLNDTVSKFSDTEKRLGKFGDKLNSLEEKTGPAPAALPLN